MIRFWYYFFVVIYGSFVVLYDEIISPHIIFCFWKIIRSFLDFVCVSWHKMRKSCNLSRITVIYTSIFVCGDFLFIAIHRFAGSHVNRHIHCCYIVLDLAFALIPIWLLFITHFIEKSKKRMRISLTSLAIHCKFSPKESPSVSVANKKIFTGKNFPLILYVESPNNYIRSSGCVCLCTHQNTRKHRTDNNMLIKDAL